MELEDNRHKAKRARRLQDEEDKKARPLRDEEDEKARRLQDEEDNKLRTDRKKHPWVWRIVDDLHRRSLRNEEAVWGALSCGWSSSGCRTAWSPACADGQHHSAHGAASLEATTRHSCGRRQEGAVAAMRVRIICCGCACHAGGARDQQKQRLGWTR